MSGQQIGSTIGAIVGSYFGPVGQAIGSAVGGYIGGVIDPTEIFGPRLTDALNQTARDGVPRAYGYGTFPCAGNIIWCSDLRERKNTEGGKGSTTETITYQYFRSYAIAVCEGPADGNGIAGYRIVKRNGKVVYDTRTDEELTSLGYSSSEIAETRAAQSKFVQRARFYYGIADQEPDPTIQAVKGADDVPGYSYTAYMVMTDDDVTELRGAVPQYEFVVSVCGDRTSNEFFPSILAVAGTGTEPTDPVIYRSEGSEVPNFEGVLQSTGADLEGATPIYVGGTWLLVGAGEFRISEDGMGTWDSGTTPGSSVPRRWAATSSAILAGYPDNTMIRSGVNENFTSLVFGVKRGPTTLMAPAARPPHLLRYTGGYFYALVDIYGGSSGGECLCRSSDPTAEYWDAVYLRGDDGDPNGKIATFYDVMELNGVLYGTLLYNIAMPSMRLCASYTEGATWTETLVIYPSDGEGPWQLENLGGVLVSLNDTSDFMWSSADDFAEAHATGLETTKTWLNVRDIPLSRMLARAGSRIYIVSGNGISESGNSCVSTIDGINFTEPETVPLPGGVTGIAAGDSFDETVYEPIPDAPGYFVNLVTGEVVGPAGTTISECAPTLAEIVEDQCALRDVTTVDVTDLEDEDVLGFRIANTSSPQKNILAAQPGYFFDSSEFDGILHFPKRGGSDSFHIPFDEMVMREGETVQWERTQEAELLRKVTFTYFDPRATYTPTSQTGERRAGTIQAMGETASQLPLVGTGDWAAKAADINLKSAWYEPDECTFPVSLDWAELVPAAVGTIEDERGTLHRVRILDIKDDGLFRLVKARRTDASAYQSNASGKPIPLPTFPGSDIRGPTVSSIFNIPAVLDSHDRPGIYWAATGLFTSWIGAVLQIQRAGQWVTLAQTVSGATVGTLAEDLPYHAGDIDTVNTLSININTTLESVTFTQLLSERNPFVIAYPDGTGEIVQFQDAELDSSGIWNCTKLLRGRLNTEQGLHLAGATVAALDSLIQFVDLRPDDLGKTMLFRVISSGTDPDTATVFSVTFDRIWSSTEWEVAELNVERDGDDFTLSWVPRHRLGTDFNPIRSSNWDGFLVRYQYGDQFFEEVITDNSKTYNLPGASDVEFTVFQLNRLTGAGPGVSVTHE